MSHYWNLLDKQAYMGLTVEDDYGADNLEFLSYVLLHDYHLIIGFHHEKLFCILEVSVLCAWNFLWQMALINYKGRLGADQKS